MNDRIHQDLQETSQLLAAAKDFSEQFLATIEAIPVGRGMQGFERLSLPEQAHGASYAMHRFETLYAPYVNSSAGPRYWGFVTGGTTPAALMGDWLTAAMDLNAADRTAVSFHMEEEALHMLRQLFGLPEGYLGCFVSGATMSNFSGLATGRQWLGMQRGINIGEEGLHALGVIKVVSATPHSSVVKSMSMMGLGRNALVRIPTLPGREAVDVLQLEQYLAAHPEER
ncbi:pyridoxal-dependent decarboxylase [Chitinophaga sp. MD30]|uniref:pyridoxal phosphate-dependent decarboxylase family protein n=1 Tax=Chitinophaga sp. MD30 TaxID=2033437 RepID=UPI0018DF7D13|nr:pyridoxal-dependent decarboxylase [Chitinophaga sp. MD30]